MSLFIKTFCKLTDTSKEFHLFNKARRAVYDISIILPIIVTDLGEHFEYPVLLHQTALPLSQEVCQRPPLRILHHYAQGVVFDEVFKVPDDVGMAQHLQNFHFTWKRRTLGL